MTKHQRIITTVLIASAAIIICLFFAGRSSASPDQPVYRTLILTNQARLEALYGPTTTTALMTGLEQLAAHPSVSGTIFLVDSDPTVAAAYADWQVSPTSTLSANAVADALHAFISARVNQYPQLEYLVLVGDDRVIPYRRMPDTTPYPEELYTGVPATTTVGAALADNMMLTDDFYGDKDAALSSTFYLPELAVGRLVETPAEMSAVIDQFLHSDKRLVQHGLTVGYDFVQDAAQAVCTVFQQDRIAADCDLIGNDWSAPELTNKLQNGTWDLAFLNTHASHALLGAPIGNSIRASDSMSWTGPLSGVLIYSIGAHNGLNVSPETPQFFDWPQAWLARGATYIANTGFGWGQSGAIGLAEKLEVLFAEQLTNDQSVAVGHALAAAKSAYFSSTIDLTELDRKTISELTLYGLPMYRINTPWEDAYEPDNTCAQAQPIASTGAAQHHTFHTVGDTDWISFTAEAGQAYWIRATPSPSNTQLSLNLNSACAARFSTVQSITGPTFIKMTAPTTGVYYLQVIADAAAAYGSQTGYDLSVAVERRLYLPLVAHNASTTATLPINLVRLEAIHPLTDSARARLLQQSMVVLNTPITNPLSQVYTSIAHAEDLSVFVTSDVLLYVYHTLVNDLLRTVEQQTLYTDTLTLVQELQADSLSLYTTLPVTQTMAQAAARHNLIVLSVARLLQEPDWPPPTVVKSEVLSYTRKITEHVAVELYPGDDYTQYLPRGHYTGDPQLERYFQTMKWLGRRIYRIQDNFYPHESDVELVATVLLSRMLQENPTAQANWQRIYDVTRQLAGPADSITPPLVLRQV